jgi:hypothetical protein
MESQQKEKRTTPSRMLVRLLGYWPAFSLTNLARFRNLANLRQFTGRPFPPLGSNQLRAMSPAIVKRNRPLSYNVFLGEGMTTLCRTPPTAQLLLTGRCLIEPWKIVLWTTLRPMHWWKWLQDGA